MGGRWGGAMLTFLCVLAGCAAAQQQQQQQQQQQLPAVFSTTDQVLQFIAQAVRTELRPVVTKLESRIASLDSRLVLLDSRVEEAVTRLDQVETQLLPKDCSELPANSTSGVYLLSLGRYGFQPPVSVYAFCDMDTDGGGWTVFQRRNNTGPHQDFFRKWKAYKAGFGDLTGEFWWGLENLHQLTSTRGRQFQLRVDLEAFDGDTSHALYRGFQVSPEEEGYTLQATDYTGTAGHGLQYSVGQQFSTRDRDRDGWSGVSCAIYRKGAWWYDGCGYSSLNGRYLDGGPDDDTGIWWRTWKGWHSLKQVQMGIRPV